LSNHVFASLETIEHLLVSLLFLAGPYKFEDELDDKIDTFILSDDDFDKLAQEIEKKMKLDDDFDEIQN